MNKHELLNCMQVLWSFYGKEPSEAQKKSQLMVWDLSFQDCKSEDLLGAVMRHLGTSKDPFFPMPRTISDLMGGPSVPSGESAWAAACLYEGSDSVERRGSLSIGIGNPITKAVFCGTNPMKRRAFIDDYEAVVKSPDMVASTVDKFNSTVTGLIRNASGIGKDKEVERLENLFIGEKSPFSKLLPSGEALTLSA